MWTHRRNVKNTRAYVNGLKKEHDSSHAEEISRNHGKDHGEQARKEAHQSGEARPRRACNYRPYKHQTHGKEARRRAVKAGPAAQKCDPLTVK
jgi:hypothetical protein